MWRPSNKMMSDIIGIPNIYEVYEPCPDNKTITFKSTDLESESHRYHIKGVYFCINMYEFLHLAKEFMKDQWLCVWSGNGYNKSIGYECSITHFMMGDVKTFKSDTEFEAIMNTLIALDKGEVDFND